jgi:hypothetical protein
MPDAFAAAGPSQTTFGTRTRLSSALLVRRPWPWNAVDQDDNVLDETIQNWTNTKAAKRLLARLMRRLGIARKRIISGKLPHMGSQALTHALG